MKFEIKFPDSLWLVLVMAMGFFSIEVVETVFLPVLEGRSNELTILIADALIPAIILMPFMWWLLKSRDRFEKGMRESEERFRTLFENAPDAIFLADPETGIIIGANSKASKLLARPHDEIIGMHQAQLHPQRHNAYVREAFKEQARRSVLKDRLPMEHLVSRSDGTEVPVEVLAQMVNIKGKQVIQGIFRDITERKKVEKEKERLINAINRSTEGITLADENDRFIYVNAAYARIFGRTQDELIGDTWRKIAPPEIIAPAEKGLSETIHNREVGVFKGEFPGLRKDGTIIPTDVSATAVWDMEGKYQGHVCIVQDITERKNTEKILEMSLKGVKEEKAKTESIIAAIGDAISIQDTDYRVLYQNRIHQDIMGDQKDKYCYIEYEHRDRICDGCPVEKSFKDGKIHTEVRRQVNNENEKGLFYEITASPLRDSAGNIIAGIEVARNITEHWLAAEALRESRDFSEKLIDSLRDGISVFNKDGVRVRVNKSLCEMTGCSEDELINGRAPFPFWPPEQIENIKENFKNMLNGTLSETEMVFMRKNGERFPVLVSVSYLLNEQGEIKNIINSVKDITERKQAEEELKRSKEFSETVLDSINHEISIINVSDFSLIDANKAVLDKLKIKKEELIGKKCFEMIHRRKSPCTFPDNICPVMETKKTGKYSMAEHTHFDKDGANRYIEVSASPIKNKKGEVIQVVHISKDITERKLAEKQVFDSLKEKEVLLREIHHRVKNNMQIISSLLWLQSENVRDNKDIEIFRDSQNRIRSMSLVHERLYRSKDLAKIDTYEYITDLTNNLFQSYGIRAGTIALNIDAGNISLGIDSSIPCGLIINELVTNSLKYAFPDNMKGEITISLRALDENNMFELVVRDNGVGIPANVDFRKTESLGLRLVTILTENQLRGSVDLDRSVGTEFKITFKGVK